MMSLQNLQGQMQAALLQDQSAPAGLLSDRGEAQFAVYRHAYRARLCGALRDNYEVLPVVMGDDAFDALAEAYIAAQPSSHYSLRWFGHLLAAFMEARDELVDHPAMVDLARMEWALRTAFDAAEAPQLTPAELAAVPPDRWSQLRFELHPSVQLLPLEWAVGPVWRALKLEHDEVPPPDALTHTMLVWREGLRTRWKSLGDLQTRFVRGLESGETFGQQCEHMAEDMVADDVVQAAVGVLSELLQMGALSRIHTAADNSVN
jgi:hypothetical protein